MLVLIVKQQCLTSL